MAEPTSTPLDVLRALDSSHPYRAVLARDPIDGPHAAAWPEARPLALELLAADVSSPAHRREAAAHRRGALLRYVTWLAADDPDLLSVDIALSEHEVLRYLATDALQRRTSHRSRVALRSLLRSFRAAYPDRYFGIADRANAPAEPSLDPVEDWQFDLALDACHGFRDPVTRFHARSVLLLCRGAGLDGRDLRWTTGEHVTKEPGAGTWVSVRRPGHERDVPVLQRHAAQLEDLALARPKTCLVSNVEPPTQSSSASVVTGLLNRNLKRLGHRFTVSPERLRKAWLVEHVGANVPLNTLLQAAGLVSLRTIEALLPHAPAAPASPNHLAHELGAIERQRTRSATTGLA